MMIPKRNALNKLILLLLIKLSGKVNGATRLQKLVFSVQSEGRKNKYLTFNYKFVRWHYGPYCKELTEDINFLFKSGLITNEDNSFELKEKGLNIIQDIDSDTLEIINKEEYLQEILNKYNNLDIVVLLRRIYDDYNIEKDYEMGDVILPVLSFYEYEYE